MGKQARLKRERKPRIVKAYIDAAREILPMVMRPDCCLNATRVCIDALGAHGVTAKPMVVDMVVANATANRMFDEHDGWPKADEDVRRWMNLGAWVVQIDGRDNGDGTDGWPHHLIATTGDMLIDSALYQAHRPMRSINLPWAVAYPRGGFGVTRDTITYDAPDGVIIGFKARPDVTSYLQMSGFSQHRQNLDVAIGVARRMHELLKEQR